MPLSPKIKQSLKAQAHLLKPIVQLGNNGLTPAVSKEVARALHDHELIKIRIATNDRALKHAWLVQLCEETEAELVAVIGKIGILYRKRTET